MAITKTIFPNRSATEVYNFLNSSNFFDSVTLTENITYNGNSATKITCKDANVTIFEFIIDVYKDFESLSVLKSKNNTVDLTGSGPSDDFEKGYSSSKGIVLVGEDDSFILIFAKTKTTNHKVLITNVGGALFQKWNGNATYVYAILDTVDDEDAYFPVLGGSTPISHSNAASGTNSLKDNLAPQAKYASKNTILIPEYTYEGVEIDGLYRRIYSPRDVAQMNTCQISFGNKEYIFDGNYALEE